VEDERLCLDTADLVVDIVGLQGLVPEKQVVHAKILGFGNQIGPLVAFEIPIENLSGSSDFFECLLQVRNLIIDMFDSYRNSDHVACNSHEFTDAFRHGGVSHRPGMLD